MFNDPVFFKPQYFEGNEQILNSHIKRCPKITVFKNTQGGGGGSYLAHGLNSCSNRRLHIAPIGVQK